MAPHGPRNGLRGGERAQTHDPTKIAISVAPALQERFTAAAASLGLDVAYEFSKKKKFTYHGHPMLYLIKKVCLKYAKREMAQYTSKDHRILDVGFTPGVELLWPDCLAVDYKSCGYTATKLEHFVDSPLGRHNSVDELPHLPAGLTAVPNRFIFHEKNANDLGEGYINQTSWALFCHSLYYFTAEEAVRIIQATSHKTGCAIIHSFPKISESYSWMSKDTKSVNKQEFSYQIYNKDGVDMVNFWSHGNDRAYSHPLNSWMYQNSVRVGDKTLIMKRHNITEYSQVVTMKIVNNVLDEEVPILRKRVEFGVDVVEFPIYNPKTYLPLEQHNAIYKKHLEYVEINQRLKGKVLSQLRKGRIRSVVMDVKREFYANNGQLMSQPHLDKVYPTLTKLVMKQHEIYERENRKEYVSNYEWVKAYNRFAEIFTMTESEYYQAYNYFYVVSFWRILFGWVLSGSQEFTTLCARLFYLSPSYIEPATYIFPWMYALYLLGWIDFSWRIAVYISLVAGSIAYLTNNKILDALRPHILSGSGALVVGYFSYIATVWLLEDFDTFVYSKTYYFDDDFDDEEEIDVDVLFTLPTVLILLVTVFVFRCFWGTVKRVYNGVNPALQDFEMMVKERNTSSLVEGKYDPNVDIPSIETIYNDDVKLAEGAVFKMKVNDPKIDDHKMKRTPGLQPIGPMCIENMPVSFSSSLHNMKVALKTRVLLNVPGPKLSFSWQSRFMAEPSYAMKVFDIAPDPFEWNSEYNFAEWNGRFSKGKKMTNEKALEEVLADNCFDSYVDAFIKREAQLLLYPQGYEPVRPRVISGIDRKTKVSTGPFALSISKRIAQKWNVNFFITYAGGMNTDMLNTWINLEEAEWVFLYTDFSKYDLRQGKCVIEMELQFYDSLGAGEKIINWETIKDMYRKTRGKYKNLISYLVEYTRKSGSNFTSVGNSIINALVWLTGCSVFYLLETLGTEISAVEDGVALVVETLTLWNEGYHDGAVVTALRQLKKDTSKRRIRCILMGDDNMTLLHPDYFSGRRADELFSVMNWTSQALGFTMTGGVSKNPLDVDFLNMIPYPTREGYFFGKKPGRNICKMGVVLRRGGRFSEDDQKAILRSNLISAQPTAAHVPFLRTYVSLMLHHLGDGRKMNLQKHYQTWQGRVHRADAVTWAYFSDKTGLCRNDERAFAEELKMNLKKYGRHFLFKSEAIARLREVNL